MISFNEYKSSKACKTEGVGPHTTRNCAFKKPDYINVENERVTCDHSIN